MHDAAKSRVTVLVQLCEGGEAQYSSWDLTRDARVLAFSDDVFRFIVMKDRVREALFVTLVICPFPR